MCTWTSEKIVLVLGLDNMDMTCFLGILCKEKWKTNNHFESCCIIGFVDMSCFFGTLCIRNYINVLDQSPIFNYVWEGCALKVNYIMNGCDYDSSLMTYILHGLHLLSQIFLHILENTSSFNIERLSKKRYRTGIWSSINLVCISSTPMSCL